MARDLTPLELQDNGKSIRGGASLVLAAVVLGPIVAGASARHRTRDLPKPSGGGESLIHLYAPASYARSPSD